MIRPFATALAFVLAMPAFAATPTAAYRSIEMRGFRIMVSPEVEADTRLRTATLGTLSDQLTGVEQVATAAQLAFFRTVPFWIEKAQNSGGATYHVSRDWLQSNGYNPDKVGGIEISNAANFGRWATTDQPMMILHELAHAYHMLVLGEQYPAIRAAYRNAVDTHLYESVAYIHGGSRRAYALMNAREYFAELTEAYFGRNDFFPYDRKELRAHDPVGFALVERVWRPQSGAPGLPTVTPTLRE